MLALWVIVYVASMLIQFLIELANGNLEKMIQGMFMLSTDSAMMCKFISIRYYNAKVRDCINGLKHPFLINLNEAELNVLKNSVKDATRLRNLYFAGCMIVLFAVTIFPLFSTKRELLFPAYFPFDMANPCKEILFI